MKTTTLIAIALLGLASCQDDETIKPQGIAYDMAGTYNVTYTPVNAPVKYVTLTVQPLSANRALLIYNPYLGSSGFQTLWLSPNDTIDFGANSIATIGPDTFTVNGTPVIHRATGTYTQNTITIPQHRHTMYNTTYTSRIEAVR
jgi:hypothetical protein